MGENGSVEELFVQGRAKVAGGAAPASSAPAAVSTASSGVAAQQDVDRRIVPVVLDAVFQEVQFTPNGRITCFGEAGLPLPQYDRMTGGEHVRAKYRGYEVELCSIELDRDVSYTDPGDPTVVNAPSYDTVYAGLWGICRYGTPMPVSLTFTPRGKLGQLVRSASVQNPVDGFEQQFKLTADDDTARNVCLTEEKCRKLLALAGTAEGSFSGSLHRNGTLHFCLLPYLCGMDAARGIQGSNRSAFYNCYLTQPVV